MVDRVHLPLLVYIPTCLLHWSAVDNNVVGKNSRIQGFDGDDNDDDGGGDGDDEAHW